MKKLTKNQKEFILNNFFRDEKFAGWANIANELLDNGQCIVAGKNCIWIGGIGNFVKTESAKGLIDCLVYKFDLDYFLSSQYFINASNANILRLKVQMDEIVNEYGELLELNSYAEELTSDKY